MKKLIQGIVDFRKQLTQESRSLFAKLAIEQKPDALFIGCSDSRVVPNLFASTNPGDLFVLRNIGNLVPLASSKETSVSAAIEFALVCLNVSDIIVCGHSECGAMRALLQEGAPPACSHLHSWLKHGEDALKKMQEGQTFDPALTPHNQLSQLNVCEQMQRLESHSCVQERLRQKKLRIHGWWFDIAQADVYCFEKCYNQFILIDEKEAQCILDRIGLLGN